MLPSGSVSSQDHHEVMTLNKIYDVVIFIIRIMHTRSKQHTKHIAHKIRVQPSAT